MPDVGNGQPNQVVAQHFGLGARVQHPNPHQGQQEVYVSELISQCDTAGMSDRSFKVRSLAGDKSVQVVQRGEGSEDTLRDSE